MTIAVPLWLILTGTHLIAVVVGLGLAVAIGAWLEDTPIE